MRFHLHTSIFHGSHSSSWNCVYNWDWAFVLTKRQGLVKAIFSSDTHELICFMLPISDCIRSSVFSFVLHACQDNHSRHCSWINLLKSCVLLRSEKGSLCLYCWLNPLWCSRSPDFLWRLNLMATTDFLWVIWHQCDRWIHLYILCRAFQMSNDQARRHFPGLLLGTSRQKVWMWLSVQPVVASVLFAVILMQAYWIHLSSHKRIRLRLIPHHKKKHAAFWKICSPRKPPSVLEVWIRLGKWLAVTCNFYESGNEKGASRLSFWFSQQHSLTLPSCVALGCFGIGITHTKSTKLACKNLWGKTPVIICLGKRRHMFTRSDQRETEKKSPTNICSWRYRIVSLRTSV